MRFKLTKGTNISHWLSQSEARGEARRRRFTRTDVERISGWGFDHIRLPIDETQMWDRAGKREVEAFELLNAALDWCDELRLRTVVDLHSLRSHSFTQTTEPDLYTVPAEAQRFADLWSDLSSFMQRRSVDRVAYELMNEPIASDPKDWNRVYQFPLSAIRKNEPERIVVVGSNRWQSVLTFDALRVPEDEHVILSFHFYEPFIVTHYRASWTDIKDYTGPVHYPGESLKEEDLAAVTNEKLRATLSRFRVPFNRQSMKDLLSQPLAARDRTGLPLYCGEFGCLHTVPDGIRGIWYRDLVNVFKEFNIAYANWDYRGGFGLLDAEGREVPAILNPVLAR